MAGLLNSTQYPFELLHSEIVAYMHRNQNDKREDIVEKPKLSFAKPNPATILEHMGYRVGYAAVEKLTKDIPRFASELDCMKFICKEFWFAVFQKQVDNLKTNHHGVYVVHDNSFYLLVPLSVGDQFKDIAPRYLGFSCGLVRGALANLGHTAIVTAEVQVMPAVKFSVNVQQKA